MIRRTAPNAVLDITLSMALPHALPVLLALMLTLKARHHAQNVLQELHQLQQLHYHLRRVKIAWLAHSHPKARLHARSVHQEHTPRSLPAHQYPTV